MSIAIAIIGLGLLIILHEGGHFLVARWCGMRVERFSIGFGPTLFGFTRGGTTYQIAPIPLGGFVQITGLNPNEEFDKTDPYVYPNRPRWMRLATVVAGPAANYLTAFLVIFFVYAVFGVSSKTQRVVEPVPGKPAALAGLKADDVLVQANGRAVSADSPISAIINDGQGKPVVIKVLRNGNPHTVTVVPEKQPSGAYQIGVNIGPVGQRDSVSAGKALVAAAQFPVVVSAGILGGLRDMITGKVAADVSGPVGITRTMAKAVQRGAVEFLELIALLSVYLGLFNLLPLPALDGGRAIFLGVEALTRRRVNPRIEAAVHMVGFVLLLGVLLIVTVKDIFVRS